MFIYIIPKIIIKGMSLEHIKEPINTKRLLGYKSPKIGKLAPNAATNIKRLTNFVNALVLIRSFCSFVSILYPAIKNLPLPKKNKIPKNTNNPIVQSFPIINS